MRCRILVVDDDAKFRESLGGVLGDLGHVVRTASNEREALSAILQDSFDFAVIDLRLHSHLPEDESGLALAAAVRQFDPRVRIIVVTGFETGSEQVVRAIRLYGAIDFIEKTAGVHEAIAQSIERACKEAGPPHLDVTREMPRLCFSLMPGQPPLVRAHGCRTHSARSWTVLRVDCERYARRTELARESLPDLRFQVQEIGNALWQEVIAQHPEAAELYSEARGRVEPLSLIFEGPRELLRVPLEFMRSQTPAEYLVLQHPMARFIYDARARNEALSPRALARMGKLRVLLIASDTEPSIPAVDAEVRQLAEFLSKQTSPPVEVTPIPTSEATHQRVRQELASPHYDIVHYAGHGFFDQASPEDSYLCFWSSKNRKGSLKRITAADLGVLLGGSHARLLYLSSCYGTTTGSETKLLDDDFLGLADAATQAGIPSVLGFRWPVSDEGARLLALSFYRSLLAQGSPEVALWQARRELASLDRNDPVWLSPMLIHQE